jgi:hypothetical protein
MKPRFTLICRHCHYSLRQYSHLYYNFFTNYFYSIVTAPKRHSLFSITVLDASLWRNQGR